MLVCCCKSLLAWLACGAATLAALRLGFAFTAGLGTFVVGTPTSLGQDAILLHFAVEAFERKLKRVTWVNFDFTHRRLPARPAVGATTAVAGTASALGLVTAAAIDGFVTTWLEGDLRFIATARAGNGVHLAWLTLTISTTTAAATTVTVPTLCFAGGAARGAAAGCVRQATARIKLLLACGKRKLLIAIATIQCLISCHVVLSRFLGTIPN